jgi:alpha-ketoglutarate-dependent taurine dioxygenase
MNPNVQTASPRQTAGAFDVIPTGAALGAEVRGVDLGDLDDATFGRLMQAWHQAVSR